MAKSYSKLSLFNMIKGQYQVSLAQGEKAIGFFKSYNDERGIADVKYSIAGVHYKTDNFHVGLIHLIDALEIYRKLEDHHNQARVYKSIGTIYEFFGDDRSAMISYDLAIASADKIGDKNLASNAYNPLSGMYLNQGNLLKAEELIEKSISMKMETGDTRGLAFGLYGRAKILLKQGKFQQAQDNYYRSIEIHEKMGEKLGRAMCYYKLGALYMEMADLEKAQETLEEALGFANKHRIVIIKFKCNYLLYELYKTRNDNIKALTYLEIYLKEKEAVINTQTQKVIESYEAKTQMEQLQKDAQMNREKAEILEKKNRAEEASRIKQEFLSTMSHEIRTPLNAITTITSLLKSHVSGEGLELLKSLRFSSANLLQIINDILDFSKLEAGKVVLEKRPLHFREVMTNISKTYETLANEKGISLKLNLDDKLSECYEFDDTKMYQILGNLLSNAVKFTDSGYIILSILILESNQNWDQIEFRITDTGRGITKDFMENIFVSFSQPISHTTKDQGGSGLGLAIVKKLIQIHGSNIEVESKQDEGSSFYFQLSLEKGVLSQESEEDISQQLNNMKVLLAEDNLINAMVAKKLLANQGISVLVAKNGQEAIEKANEQKFDAILMDIHMPVLNGFDATREILDSSDFNRETPIYALTADITAQQGEEMNHRGFKGYLLKPIEEDKLMKALASS